MKRNIPIGISDFEEMIVGNYAYVDKTLFINELISGGIKVTLIPRPRRFGKTLNLTMLKAFFEKTEHSKKHLFDGLAVSKQPEIMAHQGQSPVIFMTLKDVKHDTWEHCYAKIKKIIIAEYERHALADPLFTEKLTVNERLVYDAIINQRGSDVDYEDSLLALTRSLHRCSGRKVVILIDEYDTVIHEAYLHGFYEKAIGFMRAFLGGGLKDSTCLERSVITGILRVAKESIFSGLNNLEVCSLLAPFYTDKFGFLEQEVQVLLNDFELAEKADAVKAWYDGYRSGSRLVYNPWSILEYLRLNGTFGAHWVNTSQNNLIKKMIFGDLKQLRGELDALMLGTAIRKRIDENIIFSRLDRDTNALWTFLLFTGYLTFRNLTISETTGKTAELYIPNKEISSLFYTLVDEWLHDSIDLQNYQHMLQELVAGNIDQFKNLFAEFVLESLSTFDTSGKEPEKFYHALVLGMLLALQETHEIKSNRESGFGRYDVMIIPKDSQKPGIIIEFKKVSRAQKETLETAAQAALAQIVAKQYAADLRSRGVEQVISLAIVFDGKDVLVQEE